MSTEISGFYTSGAEFTRLLRDLIQSGKFRGVIQILEEGGLNKDQIISFLDGESEFEGDTREGDLSFISCEPMSKKPILTGWTTLSKGSARELSEVRRTQFKEDSQFNAILDFIGLDEFIERYRYDILEMLGYRVYRNEISEERVFNGVFVQDGTFIECGYQCHIYLFDHLYRLKLSSDNRWTECEKTIHVSSGSLSGQVAYGIKGDYKNELVSEDMLNSLFKWRRWINSYYSKNTGSVVRALMRREIKKNNLGAKYGILAFLKRYYAFNVADISTNPFEGEYCIRTSPKSSIPGILNSKFGVTKENLEQSLAEIRSDYENMSEELKEHNELNVFYQRFIEGYNGVCHIGDDEDDFSYDIGAQHEVVQGKITKEVDKEVREVVETEVKRIARELQKDLGKELQIEFVIDKNLVPHIVQLRFIERPRFDRGEYVDRIILAEGISFTSGEVFLTRDECLIIDNESDSCNLLGYKAIIVRDRVEFSHILALSQALNIPSLYGVGDIELPDEFSIDTRYKQGIIYMKQ